jgi:hypothetical protein
MREKFSNHSSTKAHLLWRIVITSAQGLPSMCTSASAGSCSSVDSGLGGVTGVSREMSRPVHVG